MKEIGLSKRELQVIRQLLEGKSNKQIALDLDISEHTVEFHLKNIYAKLGVRSRVEAILKLQEAPGILGDSAVDETGRMDIIESNQSELDFLNQGRSKVIRRISLEEISRFVLTYRLPIFLWIFLIVVIIVALMLPSKMEWRYEREGEYPDEFTVGQVLQRSNASGEMVHGQFGTVPAWPAQPGFVIYSNIRTPRLDHLFLKLRYSKFSSSSENISVYMDDEIDPRAVILPVDQGDWDRFIWTDAIDLGSVARGVHTLKFLTNGQVYGVADLDRFVLSAGAPDD